MASIRTAESLGAITKTSNTILTLAASRINASGQQYVIANSLVLNTAIVGVGGVDATLIASRLYYIYVVINNGAPILIASTSSNLPAGFTVARLIGYFYSNSNSQIQWASKNVQPIQTILTSGSGTYIPQATTNSLKVRLVGAGGGGGGSGLSATGTAGGTGGSTTFGTSLLVANGGGGGTGGNSVGGGGGSGGTASISLPALGLGFTGANGGGAIVNNTAATQFSFNGGLGASSPFGGAGGPGAGTSFGITAAANTGSGGSGAACPNTTTAANDGAGGGGAGAYIEATISAPATSYLYTIGVGGTPGSAGTSGNVGGSGASGIIIIDEYSL